MCWRTWAIEIKYYSSNYYSVPEPKTGGETNNPADPIELPRSPQPCWSYWASLVPVYLSRILLPKQGLTIDCSRHWQDLREELRPSATIWPQKYPISDTESELEELATARLFLRQRSADPWRAGKTRAFRMLMCQSKAFYGVWLPLLTITTLHRGGTHTNGVFC